MISLVALTAMFAVELSLFAISGADVPAVTESFWAFAFPMVLALYVYADRRSRNFSAPFDFDSFVFFAWPLVLPYYLYRTRRWRGLLLSVGLWMLFIAPSVVRVIVYIARR
jgi:hypothetical protein